MLNYLSEMLLSIKNMVENTQNSKAYGDIIGKKEIILFGAGFNGVIALDYFEENGHKVIAFCDNDNNKQGSIIESQVGNRVSCISPESLQRFEDKIVVITSKHYPHEIEAQLYNMNIANISFDEFVISRNIEKIIKVYSDLQDDFSKKTLLYLIEAVFLKNNSNIPDIWVKEQYFCLPEFLCFDSNEVFVDCGAFVGDTIEQFINSHHGIFKKIYAFEPGENQFNSLCIRKRRLINEWALNENQIDCIFAGVSDINSIGKIEFTENNLIGTRVIESSDGENSAIHIYKLDSKIENDKVTFLKADIEGYEMKMLRGAENLIKNNKPKLAISIYHKPQDLFEIALYIKNLVPEYKIAIRQHAIQLMDTVLYCWI